MDYSLTFHAVIADLSVGTGGADFTLNTGITVGITADATYTAPGVGGPTISVAPMAGQGLIAGFSASWTDAGQFAGGSVSAGYGFTAQVPNRPALLQMFGMTRAISDIRW